MSRLSRNSQTYDITIENPANRSFTNKDILIGCSKSPSVTALTANRDCTEVRVRTKYAVLSPYQLIHETDNTVKIVFYRQYKPTLPFRLNCFRSEL